MDLEQEELHRYWRQISLSEIGTAGQERLKAARILIVGIGGLGSPAALYLAGAGIGNLGLIDPDRVESSNLHRQVLYQQSDIGKIKAQVASSRLRSYNPIIKIKAYPFELTAMNAQEIISNYDIILNATDNFTARYLVNDACYFLNKTNIFSSVTSFEGRISVFSPKGPCYRCLYPTAPQDEILNCAGQGILGPVPGVFGTLQALEAIKVILNLGTSSTTSLWLGDLLTLQFRKISIQKNPQCPLCGKNPLIKKIESVGMICNPTVEITSK